MESSSLRFFRLQMARPLSSTVLPTTNLNYCSWKQKRLSLQVSAISYQKFIHFALDETKRHTHLETSSLQESYSSMISMDGTVKLQMLSFQTRKIRLMRSLSIESETMQVLDFGIFPKPEYDLPIFCANFFSNASTNIVLLDLNPLHDVISQRDYKEKYYKSLMPLGVKYAELLPWGGKLTSESLKFFSPIVIWTKFTPSQHKYDVLYSAFVDYYKAWLERMDEAAEDNNESRIVRNCEAQHRYLTWRAEKAFVAVNISIDAHIFGCLPNVEDPGHGVLKKLVGDKATKDLLRNFLFHGINELGSKSFLDYFPEYRSENGTVIEKRSIIGRSFENRPWDARGEFIGFKDKSWYLSTCEILPDNNFLERISLQVRLQNTILPTRKALWLIYRGLFVAFALCVYQQR